MHKVIKFLNTVIVVFDNGDSYHRDNMTDEEYQAIINAEDDETVISILFPYIKDKMKEKSKVEEIINSVDESNILTRVGNAVYWLEVSGLSMPKELVYSILEAESENDTIRLETYKNFWTLMSLNPDEECRNNLFWFLNRNGLVISRCGFFVAYRNVDKHKSYTEKDEVFTDRHSRTFTIRIGEIVCMPREKCDSDSNHLCSKGLHLASKEWLKKSYFGTQGLVCLCNPAEVVAVPKDDCYGKLRTCSYLPIDKAKYDELGDIIPYDAKDGFECDYVPKVIYEGLMGTEKDSAYKIEIPDIPEINKESITDRLLDLARETIVNREV